MALSEYDTQSAPVVRSQPVRWLSERLDNS
jgi:hypothetical protein